VLAGGEGAFADSSKRVIQCTARTSCRSAPSRPPGCGESAVFCKTYARTVSTTNNGGAARASCRAASAFQCCFTAHGGALRWRPGTQRLVFWIVMGRGAVARASSPVRIGPACPRRASNPQPARCHSQRNAGITHPLRAGRKSRATGVHGGGCHGVGSEEALAALAGL